MKIIKSFLVLIILLSVANFSYSQNFPVKKIEYGGHSTNFAVMVTDAMHFKVAFNTAASLDLKVNNYNFEIVVVGILAKEIAEDKSLREYIDLAEKLGVKIVVCEFALDLLKVDRSLLDNRLVLTPNAWVYMFELKDKGYNTLTIQP